MVKLRKATLYPWAALLCHLPPPFLHVARVIAHFRQPMRNAAQGCFLPPLLRHSRVFSDACSFPTTQTEIQQCANMLLSSGFFEPGDGRLRVARHPNPFK